MAGVARGMDEAAVEAKRSGVEARGRMNARVMNGGSSNIFL